MKHVTPLAAIIFVILSVQGCATRDYGRQNSLSDYEKTSMGCPEIEREMAKVMEYLEKVRSQDALFKWYDMESVVSRYWIGNNMEKGAALESANTRIIQLWSLRDAKKCSGTTATQPLSLPVEQSKVEQRF